MLHPVVFASVGRRARLISVMARPSLERQVLDALPITIYAADLDGRIIFHNRVRTPAVPANDALQRGEERAVLGTPIRDVITEPAAREQMEEAVAALREGRATSLSWEARSSAAGDERVLLMQVSVLTDGQAVTGYTFATMDITSSHRAREMVIDAGMALARTISVDGVLHEASQQLRRAMTCDAVAIALAEEGRSAPRLALHSGFADAPAALERRLTPVWVQSLASGQVTTRASHDELEITAPMTSSEGAIGALTLSTPLPSAPHRLEEVRRLLATIAAETAAAIERARLVKRAGHTQRLDAIGEMSAGVAHELRNPLFGITSAAQLLRYRVKDDPVVEKNVGRILREVDRLNSMVTSLLALGRPGAAALEAGDPDELWDEVLESQRGLLESRALLLQRMRAEPAARCAIDAQQLSQAFANVLVNAVEAAPEGSDLTLESSVLPDGGWRCRLRNGGAVIPADVLPHVFDIFFSTKPGSSGIGLALCQRIIEGHGGTITLESTAELGTVATMGIPTVA
jgi:signal transduction histidine kinase